MTTQIAYMDHKGVVRPGAALEAILEHLGGGATAPGATP